MIATSRTWLSIWLLFELNVRWMKLKFLRVESLKCGKILKALDGVFFFWLVTGIYTT